MPQAGEEIHGLDQGASGEITLDLVRAGNGFLVVKKETVAQLLPDHKKRPSHLRRR
ncbi:MAG: hypothetical protein Q8N68_01485 [bacterium]|nr:hypothetical protein [bacterium]